MEKSIIDIISCYGTHFKLNGETIYPPDSFIGFYDDKPFIATSYTTTSRGHGDSTVCKNYKFIYLDTLKEIPVKEPMQIELDHYTIKIGRDK